MISRETLGMLAFVAIFLVAPVVVISTEPVNIAVGNPVKVAVILASFATGVAGGFLFVLALVTSMAGRRRQATLDNMDRVQVYAVSGAGLFAATVTLALANAYPAIAAIYGALVLAYVLYCLPTATRRVMYRSTITVRSTPDAAFALVSDPRQWNAYLPDVQVVEPLELPLHTGSVVHDVTTVRGRAIAETEEVIAFEPGRRFGTASTFRRPSDGVYEFSPVAGGTEIAFTFLSEMTVPQAIVVGALVRGAAVERMQKRREEAMKRIKGLLESPDSVNV